MMHNFKDLVARQSHLNDHHIQITPERDDAQFQEVHIQFEDNKRIDRIEFTNIVLGQKYISITELRYGQSYHLSGIQVIRSC